MTRRETELDRITTLLGQCLGRIDEQAYRLQQSGEDETDYEACDALEREAEMLQELIDSAVMQAARAEPVDLNRVVEQSLRGCVGELGIPVVVRQQFARDLPRLACAPSALAHAVQRAITLALGGIEAGGEIRVSTRLDGDVVLLEIESRTAEQPHLDDRAATLDDFVKGLGGRCHVDHDGRGACLVAMELPAALVA